MVSERRSGNHGHSHGHGVVVVVVMFMDMNATVVMGIVTKYNI
jgi:hypothetical protein